MTIDPALPFSPFSALHHDASYDALAGRDAVGWDAFLTCNVSVDRRFLQEAGGFEPKLFWHEDIELGERLARRGMRLFYAPEARGYHHHLLDAAAYLRIAEREGAALVLWYRKRPDLVVDLGRLGLVGPPPLGAAARHRVADLAMPQALLPGWQMAARADADQPRGRPHRVAPSVPAAQAPRHRSGARSMRRSRTVLGGALVTMILPVLAACGPADAQVQQNILVDPAGGTKPGYTTVARLADVPFATLGPGSIVLIRGGSYGDVVFVGSRGTAAAPMTVAAEPGTQPRLSNSVVFENAAYVTVTRLTVQGAVNSGFIIRRGSSHVTVAGSTVSRSGLGIWIGDGSGAGHRITGNTLADNQTHGVAVDVINAPQEEPSYILDNTVTGNGIHGMEINGSGYVVEGNRVSGNGVGISDTSGIHVFAKDAAQDAGDRNTIRYNIVTGQKETTGQDGNGIQIDQWCDGNIVAFNVAADNDGAGINLFDAGSNTVVNNTTTGNMRDSGGKHVYRGEIVLASD
ncbi:right-handed parallel beta-helix repeat-containing protein [Methylobacterium sp. P5_C11]